MKILFGSIDNENANGKRGIHSVVNSMVVGCNKLGNECGMIIGLPLYKISNDNLIIDKKLKHLYINSYLEDGYKTIHSLYGKSIAGKVKKKLTQKIDNGRVLYYDLDKNYFPETKSNWIDQFKFIVSLPNFYENHLAHKQQLSAKYLKKIIKTRKIDALLLGWPTTIKKSNVGSNCKLIHFIHDVMPLEVAEENIENATPIKFSNELKSAAFESDLILVNSEDTKKKIIEINPKANIQIVYSIIRPPQLKAGQHELPALGLKPNEYILFVSSMDKRKNTLGLIKAFVNIATKSKLKLVLVGGKGYGFKEEIVPYLKSLPSSIRERIIITGHVSEKTKFQLMDNAHLFVLPSFYEGLGLTPIEAMSYGVPTIVSRRGALPEICQDASLYIEDPYDTEEISEKILELSTNNKLRLELIQKGQSIYKNYGEKIFMERLKNALDSLND